MDEPLTELALSLGILIVNASMMRVAMENVMLAPAKPGYEERLRELSAITRHEATELQDWGEAYDEPLEGS